MRRTRFSLVVLLSILPACGSDDGPLQNTPPPPETGPRMYNYAGTGESGSGDTGQLPLDTWLQWPQDITFAPDSALVVVDWGNHRVIGIDRSTGQFRQLVGTFDGVAGEPCSVYPAPCDVGA